MILSEFPDLQWLKTQIDQRFRQRLGYGNVPLESDGFPSVVINATARETYRPDIIGPVSLFLNTKGTSRCTVDGRTVTVPDDYFFLSNRLQPYTLAIESPQPVQTFNIHFGEVFSEGVLNALLTPADVILQNGTQQNFRTVAFHNRLYRKDERFIFLLNQLQALQAPGRFDKFLFDEILALLLTHLLYQHRDALQQLRKLPPVKASTKAEVYKRLCRSLDCLHAEADAVIDLDALAAAACLSKYHFLRLFKQAHGRSPYQYWQGLRVEKAKTLLQKTTMPVAEIALSLRFENSPSFSRLFRQRTGQYPSQYRAAVK